VRERARVYRRQCLRTRSFSSGELPVFGRVDLLANERLLVSGALHAGEPRAERQLRHAGGGLNASNENLTTSSVEFMSYAGRCLTVLCQLTLDTGRSSAA
jgi:hypothetical protein